MKSLPVSMGFSAQIAPKFSVQQTALQRQENLANRSMDAFVMAQLSPKDGVRVAVNGLLAPSKAPDDIFPTGEFSWNRRVPG